MTVQQLVGDGLLNEARPPKRRKVYPNDPYAPFRLVPSPQEARGLETSASLVKFTLILTIGASLGNFDPSNKRNGGVIEVRLVTDDSDLALCNAGSLPWIMRRGRI